jgi:hypothetical protein
VKLHPGSRACLCRACGRYFGGVNGFDMHRVNFQCVDPETITSKKGVRKLFLDSRGAWVSKGPKSGSAMVQEGV